MRGKKVIITCKCGCKRTREVRESDVKRGWGQFFNKSCKAKEQEKRTGQYKNYLSKSYNEVYFDEGWDEHK